MLKFKLHSKDAVIPAKASPSESGYDLTCIRFVKQIGPYTYMYDTDVSVEPPPGYFTEIVVRSSAVKTGWMLTNAVGIIDEGYRGTLKIVLTDVDSKQKNQGSNNHVSLKQGRPLTCPFTLTQLIVRKRYDLEVVIVEKDEDELSATERGEGGFGSTGAGGGTVKSKN